MSSLGPSAPTAEELSEAQAGLTSAEQALLSAETYPSPSFNWNVFRYTGDLLHLAGVLLLLFTLARALQNHNTTASCSSALSSFSMKTQVLYFLLFATRYLDLLVVSQTFYLVSFKLFYISSALGILAGLWALRRAQPPGESSEAQSSAVLFKNDTASMPALLLPCFIGACVLTKYKSFLEIAWTFSEYLEGFAMVPQYVLCYREATAVSRQSASQHQSESPTGSPPPQRDPMINPFVHRYILLLGLYRFFYVLNWIYKFVNDPDYRDPQSWLGGVVEMAFFFDYLKYNAGGSSFLRDFVLRVDDKVNDLVDIVVQGGGDLALQRGNHSSSSASGKGGGMEMRMRRAAGAGASIGNPYENVAEEEDQV